MYSPVKSVSKEDQRRQIKEQKRQQLSILLINKFRNKFCVNNVSEPQVDHLIKQEVTKLLQDSNMYESKLNQIDKVLEVKIRECRQAIKNGTFDQQPYTQ